MTIEIILIIIGVLSFSSCKKGSVIEPSEATTSDNNSPIDWEALSLSTSNTKIGQSFEILGNTKRKSRN